MTREGKRFEVVFEQKSFGEALGANPRPAGCRRLVGYDNLWRIRVGDYRVIYTTKDTELIVLALRIAHRSDVYRRI